MKEKICRVFTIMYIVTMLALNVAWIMSVTGCAAKQTEPQVDPGMQLHVNCIPQLEQSKDPCELEFWENTSYARYCRENENGVGCKE